MDVEVERFRGTHRLQPLDLTTKHARQIRQLMIGRQVELTLVVPRNDPAFQCESTGEGAKDDELGRLLDASDLDRFLAADDIAQKTAVLAIPMGQRLIVLLLQQGRDQRRGQDLRVDVILARARSSTLIPKDKDRSDRRHPRKGSRPLAVGGHDKADVVDRQVKQGSVMDRVFDDNFMAPDPRERIAQAGKRDGRMTRAQGGESIGNDPHLPSGLVSAPRQARRQQFVRRP